MSNLLMARTRFQLPALWAAIVVSFSSAWGQTHTATVRGTVTDASGALVKDVKVSLTNVDQRRQWATLTGETGEYVLVQIPPGNYKLTLEAHGFKRHERDGLVLEVAQTAELDVRLELGAPNETAQVTAEIPLIEPGSSFLGEVVNSRFAEAMPLFAHDLNQLVALTPGISDSPSFRAPKFASGNSSQFSSNGGPGGTNE